MIVLDPSWAYWALHSSSVRAFWRLPVAPRRFEDIRQEVDLHEQAQVIRNQVPLVTSLAVITASTFVTEAADLGPFFSRYLGQQGAAYASGTIVQGLSRIVLIALIAGLGLSRNAGFTRPGEWRQVWLAWPIVLLIMLVGWPFLDGSLRIDTAQRPVIVLYLLVYYRPDSTRRILCRGYVKTDVMRKCGIPVGDLPRGAYGAPSSARACRQPVPWSPLASGELAQCSTRRSSAVSLRPALAKPLDLAVDPLHALFNICRDLMRSRFEARRQCRARQHRPTRSHDCGHVPL